MQNARWSTAVVAAALLALPAATYAQSTQSSPQQNPPAPQQPQQPPASASAATAQADPNAAKSHLSQARDTLSQLTSMPEAAKLQGAARTQVSQLISDFNALITTQSEWRSAYSKVDADLSAVLGPDPAPDQPVGTSGGATEIDPAVRAKLVEFRTHLKAFEKAAGGSAAASPDPAPAAAPSEPAQPPNVANPVGTSGVTPSSPTANMDPADRARAESAVSAASNVNADAQKELDAISAILNGSKTGTLTKAQTAELKKHVAELRAALKK